MTKPTKRTKPQGAFFIGEGSTDEAHARAYEVQRAWVYAAADAIERGELPTARNERRMIAAILRASADQLQPRPRRRPGGPAKLPEDYTAAMTVRLRELRGESPADAVRAVADYYQVDESTIRKDYKDRREAIDQWFLHGYVDLEKESERAKQVLEKLRRNS